MILNFKKVASVLASAIMLSSTVGFAAAATNYPAPFVSGGTANGAVVVGANAAFSDALAAIDVAQKLNALVTTSSGTSASASGGDNVNLGTSSRKVYYGDAINVGRTSISSYEMSNVLSDSKFIDLSGTQYSYSQTIRPGVAAVTFGTSGGDLKDPALYIDAGDSGSLTAGHLYNYTLSFSKNVNVSDSTNVQGQKIKILGVDYVIGSSSTNSTLYLYGSGETVTVKGGEESKVTIAGTEHTVELVTTSSATAGTLKVDGVSKSVTEGNNYAFAGNLNIYVKDIIHPAYAGDIRQAELILGANTLKLDNSQTVKVGADQTPIRGSLATITAAGNGVISAFSVAIGMSATKTDSIEKGGFFTDPVFKGLKVQYTGAVPEIADETREKVVVNTDNNQYAYATFTSARAGEAGEEKIQFVYDNNTASSAISPILAYKTVSSNNKGRIHVLEGENALQDDWIVVNQGDSGSIIEVGTITITDGVSASVSFRDVITGLSVTDNAISVPHVVHNNFQKTGNNFLGGNNYVITIGANASATNPTINITWSVAGSRTLFPRIKLKGGGWLAFMEETVVPNNTAVILPDGQTTISSSGTTLIYNVTAWNNATAGGSVLPNGINWTIVADHSTLGVKVNGIRNAGGNCNFVTNTTQGPAILFIEPKKWNDANYGNFICVPMTTTGTTEIAIARAVINGSNSGFTSFTSDTYKSAAVDQYGAYIIDEQRTNENGVATITYPASQMYFDVLFTSDTATVVPGSAGGSGGGGQVLVVKDNEVDSAKDKNLFVVGGSCINSVAAKILDSDSPLCAADFSAKTKVSAGGYIIQTVESPYNAAKVAMLVAGYNAEDTTNAVAKAVTGVSSDKGTSTTYPEVATATTA